MLPRAAGGQWKKEREGLPCHLGAENVRRWAMEEGERVVKLGEERRDQRQDHEERVVEHGLPHDPAQWRAETEGREDGAATSWTWARSRSHWQA